MFLDEEQLFGPAFTVLAPCRVAFCKAGFLGRHKFSLELRLWQFSLCFKSNNAVTKTTKMSVFAVHGIRSPNRQNTTSDINHPKISLGRPVSHVASRLNIQTMLALWATCPQKWLGNPREMTCFKVCSWESHRTISEPSGFIQQAMFDYRRLKKIHLTECNKNIEELSTSSVRMKSAHAIA